MSRARQVASEATLDMGFPSGCGRGMNNPEVIMHNTHPRNTLIAYEKALTAAGSSIGLVRRVPAPLKSLADQVIRSASSVPANLAEGHGRVGRDRIHHWRIAYASAKEVDCHLRLLMEAGAIDRKRAAMSIDLFDEVDVAQDAPPAARAMTWRLLHPKP